MVAKRNRATSSWVDCRHALSSKWPLILLVTSIAFLLGSFLGSREGILFRATAEISLTGEEGEEMVPLASTDLRPASLNTLRRREASLRSGVLLLHVIDANNLVERWRLADRVAALRKFREMLHVEKGEESGTFSVHAMSHDSEEAGELASAVALEFVSRERSKTRAEAESQLRAFAAEIESRRNMVDAIESELMQLRSGKDEDEPTLEDEAEARDLRRRIVNVSNIIRSLEAKHQRAVVEMQKIDPGVALVSKATAEDAREVSLRWQRAGVFALFGFLISMGCVLLFAAGRSPLAVLGRIQETFRLSVIGAAPLPSTPLFRMSHPSDSVIEPYRDLRTKIHRLPAADCSVLSFVSETVDSSSADVAVNLAAVLASAGNTVLVVDGDLRGSRLHHLVEAAQQPGLTDYLRGEMRLEETVIKSRQPNLWCMPSGPMVPDPAGLLGSKRMDDLFWDMKSRFEYILITAPSIETHADAGVLAGFSDHTFIACPYADHSLSRLKRAHFSLENAGARVAGVLLTYPTQPSGFGSGTNSRSESRSRDSHHAPKGQRRSSSRKRVRA